MTLLKIPPRPKAWTDLGICGCLDYDKDGYIFYDALKIVNPKNILEIGFFAGASSFIQLYFSNAKLTSVDPMINLYDPNTKHDGLIENVQKLKDHFGADRFTFIKKDSKIVLPDIKDEKFDLIFIDGDHWDIGIRNDFNLAISLKIPYLLVDDFVTNVENVYHNEFSRFFSVIKIYPRKDQFMGKPIPIYLLKNNLV